MEYIVLARVYAELENTPAKLEKTGMIAELLKGCDRDDLPRVVMLLQGRVFPTWSDKEIGIATQLMIKAISRNTGFSEKMIMGKFRESGDLGLVTEDLVSRKKQSTLFSRNLTVGMLFENLQKLAGVGGKGSQTRKFQLVSEALGSASPLEAKYIVRTVLGDLRVGVAEGIVRDAIARAFFGELESEEFKKAVHAVEWAWFLRPDYGEVACIARDTGLKGLRGVKLDVGKPYMVLLSEKSPGLEEALKAYERPCLEYKYDGVRLCIHKKGDKVWLYTRRLEDVTEQFPEVMDAVKDVAKAKSCIIEGEMVGVDRKTGMPLPFQFLSQRIKRKYDIGRVQGEIPVRVNVFDLVYLDGKVLFGAPLKERWEKLKSVVSPVKGRFQLAEHIEGTGLKKAEAFYKEALSRGHEGLMVKNMEASYQPGRRVAGGWLKVKPTMENLDLVITGATWGTGKRAGWLGSLVLGCRDPEGGFRECGMMGTGIKEKGEGVTFEELTRLLKPYIESEKGSSVRIKPKVVVEVAYEEIQRSPNYASGYALRFPRLVRMRTLEKTAEQCDTLERVEYLYKLQKKAR